MRLELFFHLRLYVSGHILSIKEPISLLGLLAAVIFDVLPGPEQVSVFRFGVQC